MKSLLLAGLCLAATLSTVSVAHAQMSPDGRRFLGITGIGIAAGMCGVEIPPATMKKMEDAMALYGEKQQDMTQEQYDAAMKGMANNMAAHKDDVCAELKSNGIEASFADVTK